MSLGPNSQSGKAKNMPGGKGKPGLRGGSKGSYSAGDHRGKNKSSLSKGDNPFGGSGGDPRHKKR